MVIRPLSQTRRQRFLRAALVLTMAAFITQPSSAQGNIEDQLDLIKLPEGFKISLYATGVEDARSMAMGSEGTLFVGSRRSGKVLALRDTDADMKIDQQTIVASGLNMPNGVVFKNGSLWVAEVHRILRFDEIEGKLSAPGEPVVLRDDLPTERHHGWKYIGFGPDGKLYVPVGAPCNVCDEPVPYASMLRMDPDGTNQEVVARGIRNTVGFDWHPKSGELWFSDNGRDMMGDEIPPDELNRISAAGQHFGYPSCHASGIIDPEFGKAGSCADKVLPAMDLGPHVAALAVKFYTGENFPAEYQGKLFIAEHGSWNRREKSGYRIMTVDIAADGTASNYAVFAEGWLQGKKSWGRPVDLLQLADGSFLLSDDGAGVIYRIHYSGG